MFRGAVFFRTRCSIASTAFTDFAAIALNIGYFNNTHVKFEVRSFNRFGAIIDRSTVRRHTHTHTHTHTHIERKQYLRYSLRSLGGAIALPSDRLFLVISPSE